MRFIKLFLLSVIVLLATGCNPSHQPEQNTKLSTNSDQQVTERKADSQSSGGEPILPLELNDGLFHSVAEWKDDKTIFYIMNDGNGSTVYTYNLFTGKSTLFFKSDVPIVRLDANKANNLFLIQTSPSSYEAELIVLDSNGKLRYNTKIASYELQSTWNQIDHNQLFVSSFNEDWTFQTYMINIAEKTITNNPVDFPFIQWLNEKEFSYLKWDQDAPSLSAPLYIYNIEKREETLLSNDVVSNTNFINELSTIELVDDNGSAAVKFYDIKTRKLIAEMSTKLVAAYSDWAIPFLDMDSKDNKFFIFEPNELKTAFSLLSFDLETKKKQTIIDNLDNLPIKLSPNGEYVLYGARFEYIIDLANKTMKELVKLTEN